MCLSANLKIRIYNHKLHYLLAIILSLHNVGAFFSSTMTRKPTHLTQINAIINRYDVLHPFEKTFAMQPFIGCVLISFSTKVKGFLLQNFHILGNQGILFTAYPAADTQFFKTSGVVLANVCEVYACATTLLSFLWRNISTPRATVFPISSCVVWGWLYAVEPTSNRSSVK